MGVDTRGIKTIPEEFTASFFATTDYENCQIASFYPGAMGRAAEVKLSDWKGDPLDLIVISPTDPKAMIQYVEEAQMLGIPYLYDPSQQTVRLSGDELRQGVEGAYALFVNEYEFCLIEKHTAMTIDEIREHLEILVITKGEGGSIVFSNEGEVEIPVVPPKEILDPTGVGDAFRGGFLTGYGYQLDLRLCGEMGALAAAYCLEGDGPQSHYYSREDFIKRFRKHFDDAGKLDIILEKK
jgi:adenosine kinase